MSYLCVPASVSIRGLALIHLHGTRRSGLQGSVALTPYNDRLKRYRKMSFNADAVKSDYRPLMEAEVKTLSPKDHR
jgi:hypothetical protein